MALGTVPDSITCSGSLKKPSVTYRKSVKHKAQKDHWFECIHSRNSQNSWGKKNKTKHFLHMLLFWVLSPSPHPTTPVAPTVKLDWDLLDHATRPHSSTHPLPFPSLVAFFPSFPNGLAVFKFSLITGYWLLIFPLKNKQARFPRNITDLFYPWEKWW